MPVPSLGEIRKRNEQAEKKAWKAKETSALTDLLRKKGGHRAVMLLGVMKNEVPGQLLFYTPTTGIDDYIKWRGDDPPTTNRVVGIREVDEYHDVVFDLHLPYRWKGVFHDTGYEDSIQLAIIAWRRCRELLISQKVDTRYPYRGGSTLQISERVDNTYEKSAYESLEPYFIHLREQFYGKEIRQLLGQMTGLGAEVLFDYAISQVPNPRVDISEQPEFSDEKTDEIDNEGYEVTRKVAVPNTSRFQSGRMTGVVTLDTDNTIDLTLSFGEKRDNYDPWITRLTVDWVDRTKTGQHETVDIELNSGSRGSPNPTIKIKRQSSEDSTNLVPLPSIVDSYFRDAVSDIRRLTADRQPAEVGLNSASVN